jgi:transcription-repair coupling factor (superfamily II helicase)
MLFSSKHSRPRYTRLIGSSDALALAQLAETKPPHAGEGANEKDKFQTSACDVVIVPLTTALYPLPPVQHLAAYTFFIKRGEMLNVINCVSSLLLPGTVM